MRLLNLFEFSAFVFILSFGTSCLVSMNKNLHAQIDYQKPSNELVEIIDAPQTPRVSVGPQNNTMLLMQIPNLPSIAELAQRELKLAGSRIAPKIFGPSRANYISGLTFQTIKEGKQTKVTGLPEPAYIQNVTWAPNGKRIAFTCTTTKDKELHHIEPWMADVATGQARKMADVRISQTAGITPRWMPDSKSVGFVLVPDSLGDEPINDPVPKGPTVQENAGAKAPARTYQDLLENEHDKNLFDYYFSSQIATINIDGTVTKIGTPDVHWNASFSPDGKYVLVEALHRPYSYRVPASRFPRKISVWDLEGAEVFQVADLPLQEEIPIAFGSVPTGPRSVNWRPDQEASAVWVEALDGGDAGKDAELRDQVMTLAAPFKSEPSTLAKTELRYAGINWGNETIALLQEFWWKTRKTRTWQINPSQPDSPPHLVFDRSFQDRYSDPGRPMVEINSFGRYTMKLNNQNIFLSGRGASDEGDQPFLDSMDLATGKTTRIFQSAAPNYELPIEILSETDNGHPHTIIVRRESVETQPNYFVYDIDKKTDVKQLTEFDHPTPSLQGFSKEMVRYKRDDGVELSATLYLPPGYNAETDGPLPMLMWAYPTEFKSKSDAGQIQGSPHQFDRVNSWSPMIFLALGFAVLDDPTMPIIGEGEEEPNDKFIKQLVSSAQAAVDEMVRRGVTKPGMIAIGGHSYGAFMTANLLAHSDLFAAGIARSGAYNRTLTPFGFQSEERTLWEASDIYFTMSPFMHAEKVNEPLLLIHGEMDNNSGTFPMQSERYFSALKGHGATVRLVMLPYESHGYRSRESLMHMLWEQQEWMNQHLKIKSEKEKDATEN